MEERLDLWVSPLAEADLAKLSPRELQGEAWCAIRKLELGEVTPHRRLEAELADCCKLYFDAPEEDRLREEARARGENPPGPAWRVIYWFVPGQPRGLPRVQVVAVGPRMNYKVYDLARKRLGRTRTFRGKKAS